MYMVVAGCMRDKGGVVTKKKIKVKTKLLTRIHTRQKRDSPDVQAQTSS